MSNFGYSMPSYFQNMPQVGKAVAAPKADENDLLAEDKPLKPVEAPADIGDIDEIFKIFSR